jgi:hypothetical protein
LRRKAIHEENGKDLGGKFELLEFYDRFTTWCSGYPDGAGGTSTTTRTNTATTIDCSTTREITTRTPADPVGFPDATAHTAEQPWARPVTTDLADPGLPQEVNPGRRSQRRRSFPLGRPCDRRLNFLRKSTRGCASRRRRLFHRGRPCGRRLSQRPIRVTGVFGGAATAPVPAGYEIDRSRVGRG